MPKPTPEEMAALRKLEEAIREHPNLSIALLPLSEDDKSAIMRVIEREKAWMAIHRYAGSIQSIIKWVLFMILAYATLKAGGLEWLARELERFPK